jgi:transposase
VAKSYRPVQRNQVFLLPPDMSDWLAPDHLVWFVLDVVDGLDTTGLEKCRRIGGAGAAGFDPRMLLGLLVYAYCGGVRSSRQIERLCSTDVAFRVLCAQDVPDHCTIARFRADCQEVFEDLFTQVPLIAARVGLARFGTVAIDGTKIPASASIDANRGHDWLQQQVRDMVEDAKAVDAEDDCASDDGSTDRVPQVATHSGRRERIRAAAEQVARQLAQRADEHSARQKAALARRRRSEAGLPMVGRIPDGPHRLAEAQAHLARETAIHQAKLDRYAQLIAAGKKPMGRPPVPMCDSTRVQRAHRVVEAARRAEQHRTTAATRTATSKKSLPSVVANITDPQSRIMPTRRGFLQGYNAQLAVTADHMIVAVSLDQSSSDVKCLVPMMTAAQLAAAQCYGATGRPEHHSIGTVLADAGYASDANLSAPGPDRIIALAKGRDQASTARQTLVVDPGPPPAGATPRQMMAHRLRTAEGNSLYKRRGATVEPAIANLKKILDRFSRRGLRQAASELHLAATAYNLSRIHRALPA